MELLPWDFDILRLEDIGQAWIPFSELAIATTVATAW